MPQEKQIKLGTIQECRNLIADLSSKDEVALNAFCEEHGITRMMFGLDARDEVLSIARSELEFKLLYDPDSTLSADERREAGELYWNRRFVDGGDLYGRPYQI